MTYTSIESSVPLDANSYSYVPQEEEFRRFNWTLILIQIILFGVGIWNLYSATGVQDQSLGLYKNQLLWFGVGLIVTAVILIFHYSLLSRLAYFIYFANIVLLGAVLMIGRVGGGAKSWISFGGYNIQPSEMMKISLVIALAKYFESDKNVGGYNLKDLILPSALAGIPIGLIVMQPDAGTGLVLGLIFVSMILFMRIQPRTLLILLVIGATAAPLTYRFALKPYHRARIMSFLDPASDPKGAGYNSIQSMIAVGSGKLLGKGYRQGTQVRYNFLPEHHTDFIFSVFAEEHGFVGCTLLLLLFLIFLMNGLSVAQQSNDKFGLLVALGLVSIFFWHLVINLGMVLGIMPVIGVPLPYLSYGGSSLLTSMVAVAILVNIANKRFMF